ncbi:cellulose binding domain-containing protein, partial [Catellatospora sp. KI3]|uniref:cellulose binding domain-containing protein n=1 Tax=Catellatospora sp. KI3 TaxID=3041620 RepID=UPI00248230DE
GPIISPSPSPSRPPSPSPSASSAPVGCTATVSLQTWTGGFNATVRVTAGSTAIRSWSVRLTLPSGVVIVNTWNAAPSGTSGTVAFANVSYNGQVAPGQSTEFGFQANGGAASMSPSCTATT